MGETATPIAAKLAEIDSRVLLRAMTKRQLIAPTEHLEEIEAAAKEVDSLGDVGLTVKFDQVKLLTTSESIWEYFGKKGTFYALTTVLDGSGRAYVHTTKFFPGLRRDEFLPLGEGGLLVSTLKNPHWFVDIHMVVMESDSEIRDFGRYIKEAREKSSLDDFITAVTSATGFDPTAGLLVKPAVDLFLDFLVLALIKNRDDHIATIHDFYLKEQGFGDGRHPKEGLRKFLNVEAAYTIDLTPI